MVQKILQKKRKKDEKETFLDEKETEIGCMDV